MRGTRAWGGATKHGLPRAVAGRLVAEPTESVTERVANLMVLQRFGGRLRVVDEHPESAPAGMRGDSPNQCSVSAGASRGSDTGRVGKRSRNVV